MISRQAYFALSTILLASGSFFVNYYLSQKMTLAAYGEFSLVYALVVLTIPLVMFGQATSITAAYFSDEKRDCNNISREISTSYKIIAYAFVATSTIALFIYQVFYRKEYELYFVIWLLVAVLLGALKEYHLNLIVIFDRYKTYLTVSFVATLASAFSVLIRPDILGYLFSIVVSSIVFLVFGIFLYMEGRSNSLKSRTFSQKELVILGWVAIPGMLVSSLNSYIDRYMINLFIEIEDVAIYSLASVVGVGVGLTLITAILKGSSISVLRSFQIGNYDKYLNIQKNINHLLIALALTSTAGYYAAGEWLVVNIFGNKYIDSANYILPLFLAIIVVGQRQIYASPLVQKKEMHILLYISIFIVALNVALNILFIQILGIKGAILAMFLAAIVDLTIVYIFAKRHFECVNFPWQFILILSCLEVGSLL